MFGTGGSHSTNRELKYSKLKAFCEVLVRSPKVTGTLQTVDNRGMIPTAERISNICKVRVQQFT